MGGCYDTSASYARSYSRSSEEVERENKSARMRRALGKWQEGKELSDLVSAFKLHDEMNGNGFVGYLLKRQGAAEAPKEFPDIEYEVKLNIVPTACPKGCEEPKILAYLDAFDFPPTQNARFLKDALHTNATGNNHFFGSGLDERLVVIEKGGKLYLKEKNQPMPLRTGVPYEQLVVKRTEKRWETNMQEILAKTREVAAEGNEYKGYVTKEKADDFVLDARDGRIYSFTITRAHLAGTDKVQRQLEIEYAGFVPGFEPHERENERQIVSGMVDLAKYVVMLHQDATVGKCWKMRVEPTSERKYDFVSGNKGVKALTAAEIDALPFAESVKDFARTRTERGKSAARN